MAELVVDVSSNQSGVKYSDYPYGYVMIKASGSNVGLYPANMAQTHAAGFAAHGVKLGFYHMNGASHTPVEAARFFVAHLPKQYKDGDPLALDNEDVDGQRKWTPAECLAFLKEVKRLKPKSPVVLYASEYVFHAENLKAVRALGTKKWVASYGVNNGKESGNPDAGDGWGYDLWQFTSRGHVAGFQAPVDVSVMAHNIWGTVATTTPSKPSNKPTKPATPNPAKINTYVTHKVVAGETLSAIGAKYGVSWTGIATLNGIKAPYTIYVGEVLKISAIKGSAAVKSSLNTVSKVKTIKYTVKKGDSLVGIAKKYGTTWDVVYAKNKGVIGSNPNSIKIGQVLTIVVKK